MPAWPHDVHGKPAAEAPESRKLAAQIVGQFLRLFGIVTQQKRTKRKERRYSAEPVHLSRLTETANRLQQKAAGGAPHPLERDIPPRPCGAPPTFASRAQAPPTTPNHQGRQSSHRPSPPPCTQKRVPIEVQDPRTGEWQLGWVQIGQGKGSTSVLCSDPNGQSRWVERKRIRPVPGRSRPQPD